MNLLKLIVAGFATTVFVGCDSVGGRDNTCAPPSFVALSRGEARIQWVSASPLLAFPEPSLACRPVSNGSASVGLAADPLATSDDSIQAVEIVTDDLEITLSFLEIAAGSIRVEESEVLVTVSRDNKVYTARGGTIHLSALSDSNIVGQFDFATGVGSLGCFVCDTLAVRGGFNAIPLHE